MGSGPTLVFDSSAYGGLVGQDTTLGLDSGQVNAVYGGLIENTVPIGGANVPFALGATAPLVANNAVASGLVTPAVSQSWLNSLTAKAITGGLTVAGLVNAVGKGLTAATPPTAVMAKSPASILGSGSTLFLLAAVGLGIIIFGGHHLTHREA